MIQTNQKDQVFLIRPNLQTLLIGPYTSISVLYVAS